MTEICYAFVPAMRHFRSKAARLAGLGRLPRRRRDVQQQRRLPQGRTGRHVPLLPGDQGRDPRYPRPRQRLRLALSGQLGPDAWSRTRWRRPSTSASPARPAGGNARRGRHGADEDRGPAPAAAAPRAGLQGPADRLSPALCALHQPRARALLHLREPAAGCGRAVRAPARVQRRALGPALARPALSAARQWHGGRPGDGRDVVLLVDTFTTWFEPGIARAAEAVLAAAGYRVHAPATDGSRPLCCGRRRSRPAWSRKRGARPGARSRRLGPGRAGPDGGRARALLPADVPRRVRRAAAGVGDRHPGWARRAARGVSMD